jgi:ribitol-5-phosphate 2-dehydrogenase
MENTVTDGFRSKVLRLIKPYEVQEMEIERTMLRGEVAVRPVLGSVCHADLRYYTGNRRPESLAKKLPMALIHEGVGEVIGSRSDKFAPGDRVVIVPNIPGDPSLAEANPDSPEANYSAGGRFLGSGTDGIAQSVLILPDLCVVPIPADVPEEIAVLAEVSTIAHQALGRIGHRLGGRRVAVFGDGPVGYVTAALLRYYYRVPKDRLIVFGVIPEKLANFEFATCYNVNEYDFTRDGGKADIAIECTGGRFSSAAINQAIEMLVYCGVLILLGVTEELVPINTRDILEKGITVFGSSRSSFRDYPPVLGAMRDPAYQQALRRLVPDQFARVRTAADFDRVMRMASGHPHWQKVMMAFDWT